MTTVTQHLRSIPTGPAASAPTPGLATLAQKLATSSVARVASPFAVRGAVDGLAPTAAMAASRALRSSPIEDVRFEAQLRQSLLKQQLIGSAMIAIRAARAEGRALTATESQYVRHAERAVSQGASLAAPIGVGVGGAGVRPYQTQISLADVGPGHLDVTLRDARMLRGLVVHHEHIDRESLDVAPYRMISPEDNARICLHAAGQVPVTVYYGRPSFQASVKAGAAEAPKTEAIAKAFEADPITPVNTLAAAAEAVFSHGTADVKVAMDGLTAKQAITLMRDVASKTPRGPSQFFSAAFNLNRPLVDDRQSPPVTVTDPRALARLVPELAAAGGWQKVTVDSASDKVPSTPLMELLGFEALVDFVHEAHRRGLETYISGGMRDQHFEDAVLSGVGGVGVGYSMHVRGAPHLVRRLADELGARPPQRGGGAAVHARAGGDHRRPGDPGAAGEGRAGRGPPGRREGRAQHGARPVRRRGRPHRPGEDLRVGARARRGRGLAGRPGRAHARRGGHGGGARGRADRDGRAAGGSLPGHPPARRGQLRGPARPGQGAGLRLAARRSAGGGRGGWWRRAGGLSTPPRRRSQP
jgi:uncharacterized protein (UPF0264 family)